MQAENLFLHRDIRLINEVEIAISHEPELAKLLQAIIKICQTTNQKVFAAKDDKKEYSIEIMIDHNTDPAEVRLYIQEKLRIKIGQLFAALGQKRDGETEILVLTKGGYRKTTPGDLNKYRQHKTNRDKHLAEYDSRSYETIHSFLLKFRNLMS